MSARSCSNKVGNASSFVTKANGDKFTVTICVRFPRPTTTLPTIEHRSPTYLVSGLFPLRTATRHEWKEYIENAEDIKHIFGMRVLYDLREETIE